MRHEYGIEVTNDIPDQKFDAVILAVAHKEFLQMDIKALGKPMNVIIACPARKDTGVDYDD